MLMIKEWTKCNETVKFKNKWAFSHQSRHSLDLTTETNRKKQNNDQRVSFLTSSVFIINTKMNKGSASVRISGGTEKRLTRFEKLTWSVQKVGGTYPMKTVRHYIIQ